jgi:predicted ATPase
MPQQLTLAYSESNRPYTLDVWTSQIIGRDLGILKSPDSNVNYIHTKGTDYNELAKLWDSVLYASRKDDVITMLTILDDCVQDVNFLSHRTTNAGILIKRKDQREPIPLGNLGDGMYRILSIAINLANSEAGYLLIDEIDTGLHYRTITDMWRLVMQTAVRLNVQVFATTHSWDCVRSFAEALDMQDDKEIGALFRLERRDEGEIAAVRYGAEDLSFIISQNIQNLEVR